MALREEENRLMNVVDNAFDQKEGGVSIQMQRLQVMDGVLAYFEQRCDEGEVAPHPHVIAEKLAKAVDSGIPEIILASIYDPEDDERYSTCTRLRDMGVRSFKDQLDLLERGLQIEIKNTERTIATSFDSDLEQHQVRYEQLSQALTDLQRAREFSENERARADRRNIRPEDELGRQSDFFRM